MKRMLKLVFGIAAILIFIGIAIFCVVMTRYNWDFKKLSTAIYETNTHSISDTFQNISIDTNTADITFFPSPDNSVSVICYEEKNVVHTVTVEDDTLIIKCNDARKWYEHIGINFGTPTITVYLPESNYASLTIHNNTGDIEVPEAFSFLGVDISGNTGDVEWEASVSGTMKIHLNTGDIEVEKINVGALDLAVTTGDISVSSVNSNGDISVKVTTGKTFLEDVTCKNLTSTGGTGDIRLQNVVASDAFSIERSTGDVKFDGCDAASISVTTDTGDVTGSLLSDKIFLTETDTGRVDVPRLVNGGRCEITTDTGNIIIEIAK